MDASGRCLAYLQQLTLRKRRTEGRRSDPCLYRVALLSTTLAHDSAALRLAFPCLPAVPASGPLVVGAGGVHRAPGFSTDTPLAVLKPKTYRHKARPPAACKRARPLYPPGLDGAPPAKRLLAPGPYVPTFCRVGSSTALPVAQWPALARRQVGPPPPPAKQKPPAAQGPPPPPPPVRPVCTPFLGRAQAYRHQASTLHWPTLPGGAEEGLLSWPPCSGTQQPQGDSRHTALAAEEDRQGVEAPCTPRGVGGDGGVGGQASRHTEGEEGAWAVGFLLEGSGGLLLGMDQCRATVPVS